MNEIEKNIAQAEVLNDLKHSFYALAFAAQKAHLLGVSVTLNVNYVLAESHSSVVNFSLDCAAFEVKFNLDLLREMKIMSEILNKPSIKKKHDTL
jgi:hypothetical protein